MSAKGTAATMMEAKENCDILTTLRTHLAEGAAQAQMGRFVEDFDIRKVSASAVAKAATNSDTIHS